MKEKVHIYKIVSLTLAFSFTVLAFTGLVLFFAPEGRIALLSDWSFLGIDKEAYIELHIVTMTLFLTVALWHIYNNFGALTCYLKNSARRFSWIKKELWISLGIVLVFVAGTLWHLYPFQAIIDANHAIKSSWEHTQSATLSSDRLGQQSLADLAQTGLISLQKSLEFLNKEGIKATPHQRLGKLSKKLEMTPAQLIQKLKQLP